MRITKAQVAFVIVAVVLLFFAGQVRLVEEEKGLAFDFAQKYRDRDAIVVSKEAHLLYYFKHGRLVRNDYWNGRAYSFPVKVALAMPGYKTPEGEMFVDGKNPQSKFILFLSLSAPGAYGIHSAPTRFRAWLDKMEQKYPNFIFATKQDDTRGCVQVENRVIKYLFAKVDVKTPVLVMP